MKSFLLLLVAGFSYVSITLAKNVEQVIYPDFHQWQVLLGRMEALEKEHVRYHEQIKSLEKRVKIAENKLLEMEPLKNKLKSAEKKIAHLNLLERRLMRAGTRLGFIEKDLQCGKHLKAVEEENAVKSEMKYQKSNSMIYQSSDIHESPPISSKNIVEATGSVKNERDVMGQLSVEGNSYSSSRVAFSAYLSHTLQELGREHTIVFDQVEYNEGNGYDKILGVFICPVSGTYFLVASMLGFPNEQVHTEIVLDGSKTAGMDSDSRGGVEFPQGTNMAIFRCAVGQRVWVRIIEHSGTNVHGDQDRFTKFAGFLLWSDE